MARHLCAFAVIGALLATISGTGPVLAQKAGGVLKIYHRDSPASMSILEEATNSTEIPMMGVFNNLVLYKQDVPQKVVAGISQEILAEIVGTTRARVNFFMNKFKKLGFISYNGGLYVDPSLLSVVLHE